MERFPSFKSTDAIRRAVTASGSHFFDAETMRFFGSRVYDGVTEGAVFVTSEKDNSPLAAWDGQRRYTVRTIEYDYTRTRREYVDGVGWTDVAGGYTLGEVGSFGAYDDLRKARRAAKRAGEIVRADRAGRERGRNAASWVFDGNSSLEDAVGVLKAIDDCELGDTMPNPLSGESAGESIPELSTEYGLDLSDDEVATAFDQAFSDEWAEVVERTARNMISDSGVIL